MELRQLTTFRTIALTQSFTQAAVVLNYAQSSVTAQIQVLEEELGVPLFDRLGRKVTLTEAGERFLRYAERIVSLTEEAQQAVTNDNEPSGTLTLSATESLCTYRLPALLQEFHRRYPAARLQFRPLPFTELTRSVSTGIIDVAFILDPPMQSPTLCSETLSTEPIVLIAVPSHPLATARTIGPTDIAEEMVLLTETGCDYRAVFERELAASGVRPAASMEFASVEAMKQCVIAGMGVAVVPAMTVQREIAAGSLVALPWCTNMSMSFQVVWHRDKWRSPSLTAFLDLARTLLCI